GVTVTAVPDGVSVVPSPIAWHTRWVASSVPVRQTRAPAGILAPSDVATASTAAPEDGAATVSVAVSQARMSAGVSVRAQAGIATSPDSMPAPVVAVKCKV